MDIIDTAYHKAGDIIRDNVSPFGLMASSVGYRQVWARDLGISTFGAALLDDDDIVQAILTSLQTLRKYQSESGAIPISVSVADKPYVMFGVGNCSGIDAAMWFILTIRYLWSLGKIDKGVVEDFAPAIDAAARWLRCQDSNEDHLLEVPENSDWRDLWFYRNHVLYDDVLYFAAQKCIESLKQEISFSAPVSSAKTRDALNLFYWVSLKNWQEILARDKAGSFQQAQIGEIYNIITGNLQNYPFYLPYVALSDFGLECDMVGNLLAILFGVSNKEQETKILDYIDQCGAANPYPISVLDVPVQSADPRWSKWFAKAHLNMPNQYHNGGIWPFVGGFYVAALMKCGRKSEAEHHLERLAQACKLGKAHEWEFNEWLHKLSGKPMGAPRQLWSAAMYCFAFHTVTQKQVNLFGEWI